MNVSKILNLRNFGRFVHKYANNQVFAHFSEKTSKK